MSEKIEPALSADEWVDSTSVGPGCSAYLHRGQVHIATDSDSPALVVDAPGKLIALLNDALPDSDPRKITREEIDGLRSILDRYAASLGPSPVDHDEIRDTSRTEGIQSARRFLKALESYLPPL